MQCVLSKALSRGSSHQIQYKVEKAFSRVIRGEETRAFCHERVLASRLKDGQGSDLLQKTGLQDDGGLSLAAFDLVAF